MHWGKWFPCWKFNKIASWICERATGNFVFGRFPIQSPYHKRSDRTLESRLRDHRCYKSPIRSHCRNYKTVDDRYFPAKYYYYPTLRKNANITLTSLHRDTQSQRCQPHRDRQNVIIQEDIAKIRNVVTRAHKKLRDSTGFSFRFSMYISMPTFSTSFYTNPNNYYVHTSIVARTPQGFFRQKCQRSSS